MPLYIIRGLPGSGKSTLAKCMAYAMSIPHIEADQFFETKDGYKFDASRLNEAHNDCFMRTVTALTFSNGAIVANTFTRKWEYEKYVNFATDNNILYFILTCNGNYSNVHGVPEEAIERMRNRWE